MDKEARHVTVLEEAHNLLHQTSERNTGERKPQEVGRDAGQRDCEMRTYGEGFIIASGPDSLDVSVITQHEYKKYSASAGQKDRKLVVNLPD